VPDVSKLLFLALSIVVAGCSSGPRAQPIETAQTVGPTGTTDPTTGATPSATPLASLGIPGLALRQVAADLTRPLYVADAGDAPGRLYVVEQDGRIMVVEGGAVRPEPFLDLSALVTAAGNEQGLLSVAFAPDYLTSGRLFVDYTDVNGDTAIVRYQRDAIGTRADPASARVLLAIDQPAANHNGGLLLFGPDGRLYVGTGEGGGAPANGQRTDTLLGKLLRLDVRGEDYAVPLDNPFLADKAVRPEIWALGMRNPWRFSFDRETGDLWIGDVGGGAWEEIDYQPAASRGGENYGWARMEGPDCYNGPCDPTDFVLPVVAYHHGEGDCTVIGGYVYRGAAIPALRGTYLFGDYCSARFWGVDAAATASSGTAQPVLLLHADITLTSFAEDRDGELYVTDRSGGVYQVVRAP
jgi:glucose/arabinose dehydrogenase